MKNRKIFFGIFGLFLLIACGTYGMLLPQEIVPGYPSFAGHAGRLLGLAGMVLLGCTLLLGARPKYLERRLGLESMLRLHRPVALAALACLLAHAIFLLSRHAALTEQSWLEVAWRYTRQPEMLLGQLGLGLLVLAAAAAFLGKLGLLRFSVWKKIHTGVYPAVSLGLLHGLLRGGQMDSPVLIVLWAFTLGCLLDAFIRRFALVLTRRNWLPYAVRSVTPECRDMTSLLFAPLDAERTLEEGLPGQFVLLRIRGKDGWSEPHPFSLVSVPGSGEIGLSVKSNGKFTRELHKLQPDDQVLLSGPYGVFCRDALEHPRLCLIAGGVGVTPFLSLLRTLRTVETPPRVCLIWSVRTFEQAFALGELRRMQQDMPLDVTLLCSREFGERLIAIDDTGIRLEAGRVNATHLRLCVLRGARVYCCGPSEMQKSVLARFRDMGIRAGEVARESFTW